MSKGSGNGRQLSKGEKLLWHKITKDMVKQQQVEKQEFGQILGSLKSKPTSIQKAEPKKAKPKLLIDQYDEKMAKNNEYRKKLATHFKTSLTSSSKVKNSIVSQYLGDSDALNEPMEKSVRQKLQRGRAVIEARLDLHGHSQKTAHIALNSFIKNAFHQGLKTVIVVTGKGDGPISRQNLHSADFYELPEHKGILKAMVPRWLNDGTLSSFIIGWQPAHPKHGGGGAIYVQIRNKFKGTR